MQRGSSATTARFGRQTSNMTNVLNESVVEPKKNIGTCEYYSETHAQWMEATILDINRDKSGGIMSYHLDIKSNAKIGKMRNIEMTPEPAVCRQVPTSTGTVFRNTNRVGGQSGGNSRAKTARLENNAQELGASTGGPAIEGRISDFRDFFTLGESVLYFSETHQTDMKAIVKAVKTNRIDLDVKKNANVRKIRRIVEGAEQEMPPLPGYRDSTNHIASGAGARDSANDATTHRDNRDTTLTRNPSGLVTQQHNNLNGSVTSTFTARPDGTGRKKIVNTSYPMPSPGVGLSASQQSLSVTVGQPQNGNGGTINRNPVIPKSTHNKVIAQNTVIPAAALQAQKKITSSGVSPTQHSHSVTGSAVVNSARAENTVIISPSRAEQMNGKNCTPSHTTANEFRPVPLTNNFVAATSSTAKVVPDDKAIKDERKVQSLKQDSVATNVATFGVPSVVKATGTNTRTITSGANTKTNGNLFKYPASNIWNSTQPTNGGTIGNTNGNIVKSRSQVNILGQPINPATGQPINPNQIHPSPTKTVIRNGVATQVANPDVKQKPEASGPTTTTRVISPHKSDLKEGTNATVPTAANGHVPGGIHVTTTTTSGTHHKVTTTTTTVRASSANNGTTNGFGFQSSNPPATTCKSHPAKSAIARVVHHLNGQKTTIPLNAAAGNGATTSITNSTGTITNGNYVARGNGTSNRVTGSYGLISGFGANGGSTTGYGGNSNFRTNEIHKVKGTFNPACPTQQSEVKRWLQVPDAVQINRLEGFQGGLNMGIYEVSGPELLNGPQILKVVKATSNHPGLPSEGENLAKLRNEIPHIKNDKDATFPFAIHRVEHTGLSGQAETLDVLVMRKATGRRFAEVLADIWYKEPKSYTYQVFSKFGKFLKAFHLRYGNREHGDVQPSNIFYDEASKHITLIDVGGMGQKTVKNDVTHFCESIKLVAETYGEELATNGIREFTNAYRSHTSSQSVN